MSKSCKLSLAGFILLVGYASALYSDEKKTLRVWPGKAPNEPAGIEKRKAATVTGADGVIRIR